MNYVRYVEKTKESKGEIKQVDKVGLMPRHFEAYTSIYVFDKTILEYFERNGNSVAGYKGVAYCDVVWFDIDDKENPENTLSVVRSFLTQLLNDYGLSSKYVLKFFSGKKGFHLGIPSGFFGGIKPSEKVPQSVKIMTQKLMEGFSCYDPSVYNITRLFRLPNSKHAETGLYKRAISTDDIFNMSFSEIENLAKKPLETYESEFSPQEIRPFPSLVSLWEMCNTSQFAAPSPRVYQTENEGFFSPPQVNRNQNLFMMANKLFKSSSLSFSEIKDIILSIDSCSPNPLQKDNTETPSGIKQIENLLKSAAGYSDGKRPEFKNEEPDYITFGDSIPNLIQHMIKDDRGLTTSFPAFDKVLKNKMKGRLLTCIGLGGTKKSLYAQNLLITNCLNGKQRGLYSTMEMPTYELTSRFLDMTFSEEENYSQKLRRDLEENVFTEEDFILHIKERAGDRVLITETPSMTAQKYDELLQKITANHGVVDILVVDGLSMMEDKEGEYKAMSFHSKELKELAKKWDILVVAICHVTKDVARDVRDLTSYIRGSGKVFDNSDYFISFSSLYDQSDAQIKNLGFAKLYAKRGDGSVIDLIYDFNQKNLTMLESLEEPAKYLAMDREKGRKNKGKTERDDF
jgi:hypothetical protein